MNKSDNRLTLLRIRDERHLSHKDLSRILGKSLHTIKAYTLHPGSACYRPIPDEVLKILIDDEKAQKYANKVFEKGMAKMVSR